MNTVSVIYNSPKVVDYQCGFPDEAKALSHMLENLLPDIKEFEGSEYDSWIPTTIDNYFKLNPILTHIQSGLSNMDIVDYYLNKLQVNTNYYPEILDVELCEVPDNET